MTTHPTPRIYIACLASYNSGILHGKWVDATDAGVINEAIAEVIKSSPTEGAEEWAAHDYEGFPSGMGEHPDVDELAELGAAIEEHGPLVAALHNHLNGTVSGTLEYLEENYAGSYDDLETWAAEFVEETSDLSGVPDVVRYHIDWEGVARDFELNGDIFTIDGDATGDSGVHVFWNR